MAYGPQWPRSSILHEQLVDLMLENISPQLEWPLESKKVLVVGCGPGDITALRLLPSMPPDVTVIAADDLSDDMLDQARVRFTNPRLCFIQLDIETSDIEESSAWPLGPYAKVFILFTLESVLDQNLALENVNKLLCHGGEVILLLISYTAPGALYQALARSSLWEQYVQDYRHFVTPYQFSEEPEEVLKDILEEAGFWVERSERRRALHSSESLDVVKEGVKATNMSHERLPEELRNQYLAECMTEMYANGSLTVENTSPDQTYHYEYTVLFAHALKL